MIFLWDDDRHGWFSDGWVRQYGIVYKVVKYDTLLAIMYHSYPYSVAGNKVLQSVRPYVQAS